MDENYILDAWRLRNPEKFCFTWKRDFPTKVMSRLDYVLITSATMGWIEDIFIHLGYKSDHSVIGLILEPINVQRGKGYWKFNNLLVEDAEFVSKLGGEIDKVSHETNHVDHKTKW